MTEHKGLECDGPLVGAKYAQQLCVFTVPFSLSENNAENCAFLQRTHFYFE